MKTLDVFLTLLLATAMVGCGTENPFDRGPDYDDGTEVVAEGNDITFSATVVPALTACAGCHAGGTGGWTYGGGGEAYNQVLQMVDTSNPAGSLLLVKGSGNAGHGGGRVFGSASASYSDILAWIEAGANNN
jgi:hypothetical protein